MGTKNLIVNPVKTNPTVNGGVQTLNVMGNYGIESKFANMVEENAIKYMRLRDEEQLQLAKSYILEQMQDGQDFQMGLKTDDSYYKSKDKFEAFSDRTKQRRQEFEKLAKEKGIASDILDNALLRAERDFNETQAIHGKYTTDYLEEENKKRSILLFDENSKTMSKFFLNRNIEQGAEFYKDGINTLYQGFKNGYLTVDQFLNKANQERENAFMSDVYSYVNDPDGLAKLQAMSNFTYEQFVENYDYLRGKFGDYVSELTQEDYARWQRGVSSSINKINNKNKSQEKNSLYEVEKTRNEILENPIKHVLSKYGADTQKSEFAEEILLEANNIKYGTEYKSLNEIILAGKPIISTDKETTFAPLYQNASAQEIMKTRIAEIKEWGEYSPEYVGDAVANGGYMDMAGIVMGARGIKLYQEDKDFKDFYDGLYSEQSRKAQSMLPDVKLNSGQFVEGIKSVYGTKKSGTGITGFMSGQRETIDNITKISDPFVFIKTLEDLAITGDPEATRMYADIQGQFTDLIKTTIVAETGGVVTEDLADEIGIKKYDVPISALDKSEREKLIQYYMNDPEKLLNGETKKMFDKALGSWMKGYQTVNLGTAGGLIIPDTMNGRDVSNAVSNFLSVDREYWLPGLKTQASRRRIKIQQRFGTGIMIPTYGEQPLFNKDGSQIYFVLEDELKEVAND